MKTDGAMVKTIFNLQAILPITHPNLVTHPSLNLLKVLMREIN